MYYLWKLVGGNKCVVRFGYYEDVIKSQVVDICQCMSQVNVVYGFDWMNKEL